MTAAILPSPAERRLARELAEIRSALDTIRESQRATQLANSTLYGNLTARDPNGTVRGVIGTQPDGAWAIVAQNGPPPDRPATPIATPSMSGIVVTWNGQLVSGRPADLLGVRVYVSRLGESFVPDDTNYVGLLQHAGDLPVGPLDAGVTFWVKFRAQSVSVDAQGEPILGVESFATSVVPGQVVAAAVIAGIVDDLALAAEAVTEAKLAAGAVTGTRIADDSISSPKIVAQAILALHIAADQIQAGHIAADTITGREIRALSILAEHIAANQIDAGHLKAGIIDADKLAATLVMATRIVLGDPTGARMELDATGLDQFDDSGARTLQFGADPAGGNFLTILDPANPAAALASIADNGVVTAQSFQVAGSLGYQGGEISEQFDALPKGFVTWGWRQTGDFTTDMTGIGELEAQCRPGRMYRIGHSACFVEPAASGQVGGDGGLTQGEMRLHYTTDGTRPTTASRVLGTTGRSAPGDFGGLMANFGQYSNNGAADVRLRVLITYQSHHGLSSRFITGNYDNGLLFWIEDVGPAIPAGGVSSTGGGTGTPAVATYTREWTATWARSWANGGFALRFSNGEMIQGYYDDGVNGDNVAAFGFDTASIQGALIGATIDTVAVYLYAHSWYWNSGGQARIRTHNFAVSDTLGAVSPTVAAPTLGKPEGRWIVLPTTVGDNFRGGTVQGFALDARDVARDLINYGRFDGIGWGSPPRLKIIFRAGGTGGSPTPGGGSSVPPPTNFTCTADAATRVVTNIWSAAAGVDATEIHEFLVDPSNTLKATIPAPGNQRASEPLAGGREYLYAARSVLNGVTSGFSDHIRIKSDWSVVNENAADPWTPGGGGGGGGTGGLPKTPGEGQWIGTQTGQNKYNIGIGESTTAHVDHSLAEIAAGFTSQWYQLSSDKLWTICKVQIDAATTSSGTKYARCEHRELGLNGTDKAAWDGTTGEHRLKHISKIMHVPPNKSSVCFSQIHNASSDLVRLQTEGSNGSLKLVLRNTPPGSSTETVRTVQASYTLGAEVSVAWSVVNGSGTVTINGTAWTFPAGDTGCYFKYGAYAQTNETIDNATDTCEVWVKNGSVETWHTGYPAPSTPTWLTGGTTPPPTPTPTPITRKAGVGGVATPAGATLATSDSTSALNITSGGTSSAPRVYDGQGHTCGRITVTASNVVVQNYNVRSGNQYGAVLNADNITFQNNDIKNVRVSGDGDLNAMTVWGNGIKILYNTAQDFVSGDPGGSHTDFMQTWVSSSHPVNSSNWQIIGNVATGPANPGRNNSIPSIHQCLMVESAGRGGNSGGSGSQNNWQVCSNTFGASWGQDMKFDTASTGIDICHNKMVGSSDRCIENDAGGGIKWWSSNTVGSGYGSIGMSVTSGTGPANPYA